jgi:hypothetical protein
MIERDGKAVCITAEDLKFIIDYKGNGVALKDRTEAINTLKAEILGGKP